MTQEIITHHDKENVTWVLQILTCQTDLIDEYNPHQCQIFYSHNYHLLMRMCYLSILLFIYLIISQMVCGNKSDSLPASSIRLIASYQEKYPTPPILGKLILFRPHRIPSPIIPSHASLFHFNLEMTDELHQNLRKEK